MTRKILLIVLLFAAGASFVFGQAHFKKYAIKSGIIKFKWEGFIKGEQTTFFDDYGYYEATYQDTKSTLMGFTTESKEIQIMRGAEQYTIDPVAKTGIKTVNPLLESFEKKPNKNYEDLGKNMIKSLGFKKVGNEKILGKPCEIYEGMGKVWIWNGFSLKSETNNMSIAATLTATELKMDVSVPNEKFEIPKGIKITEQTEMMMDEGDDEASSEEAKELMKGIKNMFKTDDGEE